MVWRIWRATSNFLRTLTTTFTGIAVPTGISPYMWTFTTYSPAGIPRLYVIS